MAAGQSEVTAEHLADLRSVREAQLVRKFAAGQPMLELEMAEIAHLVPAAALADPPELQVEYAREAPEYAAEIGVDKRTVYRWISMGVAARDPVPLDQPGQILAWWARHMSQSSPEYLVKWAANAKPAGQGRAAAGEEKFAQGMKPTAVAPSGAGVAAAGGDDDSRRQPPARQAIELAGMSGMGLEAAVKLLRQTVEANSRLVSNALADPDDSALAHYQTRFEKSIEQLRKAEEALFKFQKMRGDLAPKSEFRADLISIATGLRGMTRRRAANVTAKVRLSLDDLKLDPAFAAELLGRVRAAVEAEGERDAHELRTCRFWRAQPDGGVDPAAAPMPAAAPSPAPA